MRLTDLNEKDYLFTLMPTVKEFVGIKPVFELFKAEMKSFNDSKDAKDYKLVALNRGKAYYISLKNSPENVTEN